MPRGVEDPLLDRLPPGLAAQPGHDLAEQPVAEVGVVEAPVGVEGRGGAVVGRGELLEGPALGALPPRPGRLGLQPAGVGEQLADRCGRRSRPRRARRRPARRGTAAPSSTSWRTSTAVRVLVIEPTLYCVSVTSPGTSPDAVGPGQPAVAHDAGDDRGHLALGLRRGQPPAQPPRGVVGDGVADRVGAAHSANASGGGQAQTRLRSPYAWSIRATGGQYLSGSTPVGKTPDLAGVGAVPLADQRPRGVRGVAQRRVLGAPGPGLHLGDLLADGDHRVAEAVDLGEVLGLGRLDHQRARRPGTTWSARGSRSRRAAWPRRRR